MTIAGTPLDRLSAINPERPEAERLVTTEDKWVLVLAGFSILLLIGGTVLSKALSTAPPRVIRTVWPVAAALTGACYATLVYIARVRVKG
jgi:hypothetical protein